MRIRTAWTLCVLLVACGGDAAPAAQGADAPRVVSASAREDRAEPAQPTGASTPTDATSGVRRIGENAYEVDAEMVRSYLDDPLAPRAARLVPSLKDGQPNGIKLYGIRPGSFVAALGLKNGDRVDAIDGRKLGDMNQVFEVFEHLTSVLRAGKRATIGVSIDRRGAPLRLTYRVVPSEKKGEKKRPK